MKILMVLDHDFPPDIRVEKEIKALTNNNHHVILACYNYKKKLPLFEEKGNLKIYRKKISSITYKSSVAILKIPIYFNFWKKFVFDILEKEKVDAIHIHDLPLTKLGVIVKNKYRIPLIVDLHENWPASMETAAHTNTFFGKILSSNKQWRKYEKQILTHADSIITVVEEMKKRICALGIQKDKISVVSNTLPINELCFKEKTNNNDFIDLFYAGGIQHHRGLHIIIKAFPGILKVTPNARFIIAGNGSYEPNLKALAKQLNLDKYIIFLGWKKQAEVYDLLFEADIAVIPHLKSEQTDCSSPNKIYQYIYAKKPILTSNCDSLVRIISETKSGLSYINNSPEDFERAYIKLVQDREQIINLEYGKSLIDSKYNWELDSKKLVLLYKNLAENKSN